MLVKKSVLNEINKEGKVHLRFKGLKEDQKDSISKFGQPSNLLTKLPNC